MTEDAKPGLRLGPVLKEEISSAKLQGLAVDDAVASSLLQQANIGRLARNDRENPGFDDDGSETRDSDGLDDGSLF